MMLDEAQPVSLAICVLHHPASDLASGLRSRIYRHYRRDPHRNLGESGLGLEVEYRSDPAPPALTPIPVAFHRAQATAVVAILDRDFARDPDFRDYVMQVASEAKPLFPRAAMLAVAVDDEGHRLARTAEAGGWQTLDARGWSGGFHRRLFTAVDHHLCGMLAAFLESRRNPAASPAALRRAFASKVQVFLSHSKHDTDGRGEAIARNLEQALGAMGAGTFFDAVDVPPGTPWEDMLDDAASTHAMVAILTDSYSSRTWCRKEVLAAKRAGLPILVANCLEDYEERGFPYVGNVPVVQMMPDAAARQPELIGRLFDEVLRHLVWRCNIPDASPRDVLFLPRAPELVSLAYLERDLAENGMVRPMTVVYPGVPLGAEEADLFAAVAQHVRLLPFVAWKAGIDP